jgi:protein-S-isoprenylcysteine O-methyltransferase Ste14
MIDEGVFFHWLLTGWFLLSALTFLVLLFIPAPYGRYLRPGWGPRISARAGWVMMESTVVVVFGAFWLLGRNPFSSGPLLLLLIWQSHYLYRAFVFPFRMRGGGSMPLLIVFSGMLFNVVNGYLNGRWLFTLSGHDYSQGWGEPRCAIGLLLFFSGMVINHRADGRLRRLRRRNGERYGIPRGGLYRLISCPNYFGEIIEWAGWAMLSWSLPGLAFLVWTAANLVPRALHHHRWYRETFPDYPPERKALIPWMM